MPFFFSYLYGNNNIMAKNNQNDELARGKKLLKDQVAEVGYLDEAFRSLGDKIQTAFEDLSDTLEGNLDMTEKIAQSYEKDIGGSIKKMMRGLENNIGLQNKINKGQNVSKQIENERLKLATRNRYTQELINKAFGKGTAQADKLNGMLEDAVKFQEDNLDALEESNKEKQKSVSLWGVIGNALGKYADKLDSTGTLSGILKGNWKDVVTTQRVGQLASANLISGLVKGILELDKLQTQYNKSFGLTNSQAASVHDRMSDIATASGRNSLTFRDIHKTMQGIGDATGVLGTGLRDDVLEEATELQKLLGLSNKGMAMLAFNEQVTGQNMEAQSQSMMRGLQASEQELGVTIHKQSVFKAVGETSGLIRANFGRNVEHLTKTLAKAQALGLTLQDLASISKNLLDFQSSIEAELTAELFLGKQLNLEKARMYALTGDYSNLMKEIQGQLGSEYEFLSMNVMAKEKYAAALGMSVDQMSDLIFKEGDLAAIKEQATAAGDKDVLNMLKERDLSERLADIMAKVQTTFIDIAEGPLGKLGNLMGELLQNTTALKTVLGLVAAVKLAGLITSVITLGTSLGAATVGGAFLTGVLTLGIGLAIAAVAASAFLGSMKKEKSKVIKPQSRHNTLGASEMVSLDRGSAIFDEGETVVRTDNFAKLTRGINELIGVTKEKNLSFTVETHHATRYR